MRRILLILLLLISISSNSLADDYSGYWKLKVDVPNVWIKTSKGEFITEHLQKTFQFYLGNHWCDQICSYACDTLGCIETECSDDVCYYQLEGDMWGYLYVTEDETKSIIELQLEDREYFYHFKKKVLKPFQRIEGVIEVESFQLSVFGKGKFILRRIQ